MPGAHETLISQEIFDVVQLTMKKNCGPSKILKCKPERQCLLKGIIRCTCCGMPMWTQTYQNGQRYYREQKNSRSIGICPTARSSNPCSLADEQVI